MAHFVLDSYAMLAFFRNEKGRDIVERLLNEAVANKHELYMTCINAGEVYYITCRKESVAKADIVWKALQHNIPTIVEDAKHNSSLFSTAVLYTMPQIDAIAAKMQVVYKDELHCKMLKQLSSELLQQHNSVTAANNLYEAIST